MNRIYRTVYNHSLGLWQAVSEAARARGKSAGASTRGASSQCRAAAGALALTLIAGPALGAEDVLIEDESWTVDYYGAHGVLWNDLQSLIVGQYGEGDLTIASNMEVKNWGVSVIGEFAGSRGAVTVTGNETLFQSRGLFVGREGDGTVTIESGATLHTGGFDVDGMSTYGPSVIGFASGSSGSVTVTGAGSAWHMTGIHPNYEYTSRSVTPSRRDLVVGDKGHGTLYIEDGGSVLDASAYIGAAGNGSIIVRGVGSTLDNSVDLYIGESGTGSLYIEDGGTVTNLIGRLGLNPGSVGQAAVRGAGSSWTNSNDLYVGIDGTAVLLIGDGGAVSSARGVLGEATVTVTGSGSTWTAGYGRMNGTATLNIGAYDLTDTAGTVTFDYLDTSGAGNGTVNFNQTDDITLGMSIRGNIAVNQRGSGTTTLTGASTYTGATTISGGALLVNGAIDSVVTVQSGGTLAGKGTIGGASVLDGGTLAVGNSIGTLTVDGDLTLSSGSILEFELGSPAESSYTPGTSDRITVKGDLALNGTLNLSQSDDPADGTANLGYYRLMTYGGALTSNTLEIGSTPALGETEYDVQAGHGRVDLFIGVSPVLGSDTLQQWQIGDGVWNADNVHWQNHDGNTPLTWAGHHAVFKDTNGYTGGTITVEGSQSFQGLQFVDDGYRLEGAGQLVTDSGGSEIRVLANSATIATEITGTGGVVKTEGGTLTLTGDNSYVGDTVVNDGTLILTGNNSYTGATVINGGTLALSGSASINNTSGLTLTNDGRFDISGMSGADITFEELSGTTGTSIFLGGKHLNLDLVDEHEFAGAIEGSGGLTQYGTGTLILAGPNSYTGGTTIKAGTVAVDGGGIAHSGATMMVADVDGGELRILNGGTVSNASGYIGYESDSSGTVTVSGSGSTWTNTDNLLPGLRGELFVGYDGLGSLTVADGGAVSNSAGYLGRNAGSSGAVTVTGAGSIWSNAKDLFVGWYGIGTLRIENGGAVDNNIGYVVGNSSGSSAATVTGAGSTWTNRSRLYVGGEGIATLTIEQGGTVSSADGGIGGSLEAHGTVTVTGAGSSWTTPGDLYVGYYGTGTLNIGAYDLSDTAGNIAAARITTLDPGSGTVNFNQTDDISFAVPIEGNITLNQRGSGTTILTGTHSYAGATTVSGGTLLVNGTSANSAVTVQSGGTLGGNGTVGGTSVSAGGTLAAGNSIGTLTVNGDLTLSAGSALDFELGSPGAGPDTPGGGDRIVVNGNLALNGTLNLSQSDDPADGTASPGYYRLMTYSGDLTSNTAAIGTVPTLTEAALFEIQTGSGRIDLFIAAVGDDTLQHWQGGDGTWDASGAGWLNQWGDKPVAWAGHHAVFKDADGHTGGTITVEGTRSFQGLQFVDEGYRLEGDGQLAADANGSEIRVLADSATITTEITGAGGIVKTEAGTLILAGNNSYSGATVINGGTLALSGSGSIANTSGLTLTNSGRFDISGLSGADMALKHLSGSAGTSVALGSKHLNLDLANDTEFAGAIAGSGGLTKDGAGTLTLSGDSSYTGATTVADGALLVNGSIAHSAVTVRPGALLGGSGSVGGLQVSDNAVLSPGNSIGSLSVAGDLSFASGSVYEVEVDPRSDASDHIHLSGVATLNGAAVRQIGESGTYRPFSSYTILTAEGGIDGEFGEVSSVFAFLDPQLRYDAHNVYLELQRNDVAFADYAASRNQRETAEGLESLQQDDPLYQQVVMLDAASAPTAFDSLSGDSLLANLNAGRDMQRRFSADLRRQSAALGLTGGDLGTGDRHGQSEGVTTWVQAESFHFEEDYEQGIGNAEYRSHGESLAVGAQLGDGPWLLGAAASTANASLDYRNRRAQGEMDAYFLGAYGRWQSEGGLYLRGDLSYGWMDAQAERTVNQHNLTANTELNGTRMALETGLEVPWQGVNLLPYVQVSGEWLKRDGLREHGDSGAELAVDRVRLNRGELTLGLDLSKPFRTGTMQGRVHAGIAAVEPFGDTQAAQTAFFQTGSEGFDVYSADLDGTQGELSLSAELSIDRQLSVWAGYRGQVGQTGELHEGQVGLAYRW